MICLMLQSCDKEFLEKKPDKALLVPTALKDFQTLMDNELVMNVSPALGVIGSDEYYLTDALLTSLTGMEINTYLWKKEIYDAGEQVNDWNYPYQQVFYANAVLQGLEQAGREKESPGQWDKMKGSALFYRAHAFYQLAQLFAIPYHPVTAASDRGIPLRLSPDVTTVSKRASVKESYERVIADLTEAVALLPLQADYKTRPTRAAGLALLARTYLAMQDYDKALAHSESALALKSTLIDFNTLNTSLAKPIAGKNEEIIFYSSMLSYIFSFRALISQADVDNYADNDLRKAAFFTTRANGDINFKGTYTGNLEYFGGLAVDELYLIRAECLARKGKAPEALGVLNTLLEKRWKQGTFVPQSAASADEALELVLEERKKELLFRGTRWTDLRRLNTETRFAVTLTRSANSPVTSLPPNDKRYIMPIPDPEVLINGIEQNER